MKLSEVTTGAVADYIRLDDADRTEDELRSLEVMMAAATAYLTGYTGLPVSGEGDCLDNHEDVTVAFLVLCQSMHDDRSMTVDTGNVNPVVDSILGMHCRNLVG